MYRKILKALLIALIVVIAAVAAILIYAVISDYRPKEKTVIGVYDSPGKLEDSLTLSLLTWNIGYCGLDSKMDFFYDGGTKVFTPKEELVKNLSAVMAFIKGNDTIDAIFLQEVDRKSKRSYNLDEYSTLTTHSKFKSYSFAPNYKVFFVPVPLSSPMGKVYSGIATLTRYVPESCVRYSFPGTYGFPKQLFMLDRCFMVSRFPMKNGKELLLINTHNEAFDPGEIRKKQMEYLKIFVTQEYDKGNYIIAGGDWNQCPPDFKPEFTANKINTDQMVMNSDFLKSDWKWVYDSKTPSNRTVIAAYDPAVTTTTVIDFFLLSPNVKALSVQTIDLGFTNSDHNPVRMKVKLN